MLLCHAKLGERSGGGNRDSWGGNRDSWVGGVLWGRERKSSDREVDYKGAMAFAPDGHALQAGAAWLHACARKAGLNCSFLLLHSAPLGVCMCSSLYFPLIGQCGEDTHTCLESGCGCRQRHISNVPAQTSVSDSRIPRSFQTTNEL